MAHGQNDFLTITRNLRLYVPQLPVTLAEQFIRDRYRRILERRDWSATIREAEFILQPAKSAGTVAVTQNSTSVVGTGTSFASTDIGRQFKAGIGSPVYTIVDVVSQTLTLDRVFGPVSNSAITYYVFDGYVTPPVDFLRFILVSDPLQGWKLRHWITAQELMAMDPMRTFFGQPYVLADRMYNQYLTGGQAPRPQYEAWPYTTAGRTLYYTYIIRPPDLVNATDIPIWPINTDTIVKGALADVARWPGTVTQPNPYFARPDYWKSYEADFEDRMVEMERIDEDVYVSMLDLDPFSSYPLAPLSASFVQSHALR